MLSAVHGKILIAVGVASDLHRPRDPLPAPGIDTPAESPLAIRGGPALSAVIEPVLVAVGQVEIVKVSGRLVFLGQLCQYPVELSPARLLQLVGVCVQGIPRPHGLVVTDCIPEDGHVLLRRCHQMEILQELLLGDLRALR